MFRYFYLCCTDSSHSKLSFCIQGQCRGALSSPDTHPTVSHTLVVLHPCVTALAMLGTILRSSYHHELLPLQPLYCSNDMRTELISPAMLSRKASNPSCCKRQGSYTCACVGTTPQGSTSGWEPVAQSQLQQTLPKYIHSQICAHSNIRWDLQNSWSDEQQQDK